MINQYNVRPPSYKLVNKSPSNYSYLRTINHSEIGVMFTNLAIVRALTLYTPYTIEKSFDSRTQIALWTPWPRGSASPVRSTRLGTAGAKSSETATPWTRTSSHCPSQIFVKSTGVGKCPNWTSPKCWGYNFQQIFEGDVQNPWSTGSVQSSSIEKRGRRARPQT